MRPLTPLILLVLAPVASAQEKTLFAEPFAEKLADGWTWLREDPKGWRLEKGTLIVRTAQGGLWMKDNGGSNILLRTPPMVKKMASWLWRFWSIFSRSTPTRMPA